MVFCIFMGFSLGKYSSRGYQNHNHNNNHPQNNSPDSALQSHMSNSQNCVSKCVTAVHVLEYLWPTTKYAFSLARITPKTELACERICAVKSIRNAVKDII